MCASQVVQPAISYQSSAFCLNHSMMSILFNIFLHHPTLPSSPFVLSLLHYMWDICVLIQTPSPTFLILWCIYFYVCLLCLLGCICTALILNLFCLSRKLFLTAITPDGFLSIFLQLFKKLYFLKPCEFFLRVLHNSMYSTISFPPIFSFPSCFSFC